MHVIAYNAFCVLSLSFTVLMIFSSQCERATDDMKSILIAILTILICACQATSPDKTQVPSASTTFDPGFVAMANQTALEKSAAQQVIEAANRDGLEISTLLCAEVSKFGSPELAAELRRNLSEDNELPNPPVNATISLVLFCGEDHPELAVGLDKDGLLVSIYG